MAVGLYTAKAVGFFLAYYASKCGADYKSLLHFKYVEIPLLLFAEIILAEAVLLAFLFF